jgi:nicotinate-nucleotide pyrophosphorylase (carboxylating)
MNEFTTLYPPPDAQVQADVTRALAEDLGRGDATADLLPAEAQARAAIRCREDAVIAGRAWVDTCFRRLDPNVKLTWRAAEGERVARDFVVCEIQGLARALVSAERSALNFLQLLSGTATATAAYVAAVRGTGCRILDTRKTIPGLRVAQKYAVRVGGGVNHRIGLFDAVMLKENHILAAGSIAAAAQRARQLHPDLPLICEVEALDELEQAIGAGVDRVLIDDFSLDLMREAVRVAAGRLPLEVSGGVTLETVRQYAETGVDYISVGSLTKHVRAVDFSMRLIG